MNREEAIDIIRKNIPHLGIGAAEMTEALNELIPELRESEDERIRKELLSFIESVQHSYLCATDRIEKWIAYLEKQKYDRMKPVYDNQDSFESALEKAWKDYNDSGARTVDGCEDDYVECAHAKGFREGYLFGIEKQEQKPAWSEEDEEALDMCLDAIPKKWKTKSGILLTKWLKDNIQPQPKQEWSKEDEMYLSQAIETLEHENYLVLADKLKSLRPQPKQEWNEEDEKMMDSILNELGQHYKACTSRDCPSASFSFKAYQKEIDWLKSLRPSWKPSEEQMSMLRAIVNDPNNVGAESCHLAMQSLYNDLLKLK